MVPAATFRQYLNDNLEIRDLLFKMGTLRDTAMLASRNFGAQCGEALLPAGVNGQRSGKDAHRNPRLWIGHRGSVENQKSTRRYCGNSEGVTGEGRAALGISPAANRLQGRRISNGR